MATEEEISCPVCWVSWNPENATADDSSSAAATAESHVVFAKTPCNHVYCRDCIERVLLPDIATMGTCPMCRTSISIFDLINATTENPFYPSNSDASSWPMANNTYKQFPVSRGIVERHRPQTDELFRNISFCFNQGCIPKLLYIISSEDTGETSDSDDLQSVDFERYHFHPPSMTFHGKIDFTTPISHPCGDSMCYTYNSFNCMLQFSTCGNYIRDGYILWGFEPTTTDEYPLDGKWRVEFQFGESVEIYLQKHRFNCYGYNYEISLDDNHYPMFEWPREAEGRSVVQRSNQQIPPGTNGPSVGETLEWSTDLTSYSRIVWKRISMELSPQSDGQRLRTRPDQFVYRNEDFEAQLPPYVATSIWGNTFCQMFTVGLASYHFEEASDEASGDYRAYISYEHPHTSVWPALDNGEKIPERVPFRNIEWNADERIFKGDICWQEDYNTTWMGEHLWQYEIKFDPKFMFIQSGTVTRSNSQEPHQFGHDLVYINAALESILRDLRETITTTGEYLDIVRKWRQHRASGATLEMMGDVAMRVLDNAENSSFDFNLYR